MTCTIVMMCVPPPPGPVCIPGMSAAYQGRQLRTEWCRSGSSLYGCYQAELPALAVDSVEAERLVADLTESFREWRLDLERVWRAAL